MRRKVLIFYCHLFHRKSYADAVRSLPKPNLVAALNCGFIFYKVLTVLKPFK